jgi:16S rRNA (cytidine1402-2'-O)-methyltransferase
VEEMKSNMTGENTSPKKTASLEAGLYLVATPIGNLEDITLRAIRILKECTLIACEDTRTSAVLLRHYGITTRTVSYHDHNGETMRPKLLAHIAAGEAVALISDAGTPLVCDPGYKLSRAVIEAGHRVIPIPGASSVLMALSGSGLASDNFSFIGFLPPKSAARKQVLEAHRHTTHTLIAFEAPSRLAKSLADMVELWGESRKIVVARELTKRFEEYRRGTVQELAQYYTKEASPRGEIVLVIGASEQEKHSSEDCDTLLHQALRTHSLKDAAALVATATGISKRTLYQRALSLSQES